MILHSEVQTRLLGSGFDTNCFDYDLDHEFENYNMRSDCITSCIRHLSSKFGENIILDHLMRKEFYQNRKDIKAIFPRINDKEFLSNIERNEIHCLQGCRKDCKFTYFINNYKEMDKYSSKFSSIAIKHNNLPDILSTHSPEITFNAFICNFGGLLSLWLGLKCFRDFQ